MAAACIVGPSANGSCKVDGSQGLVQMCHTGKEWFEQCVSDNVSCDAMFIFDFHFKPAETHQIGHTSTGHSIEKRLGCAMKGSYSGLMDVCS